MAVVEQLIRKENNETISFGNYLLDTKTKVSDFEFNGDLYKVKTYQEITKLEKNGSLIYESVPGTAVFDMELKDRECSFIVEGAKDAQITLEVEPEKEYKIYIDKINVGKMRSNLGGKLLLSVELNEKLKADIKVVKL